MPLYDYRCQECGYDFEVKQSFHDNPIADCPNCSTEGSVVRVIGPAGVVFKGSGFYINDSRGSRSNLTGNGHGSDNGNGNGHSENGNGKTKPESKSTKETASSTTTE
ncbi:MAG: zinc ribbon domain-containing protein [Chloroflexi bacterium]|nr:zinc ribbon domain-containing protein [Chloroflexota bacterium]